MNLLITGANGFMGRNLCETLALLPGHRLWRIDVDSAEGELDEAIRQADFVFHLAGVNRPQNADEYMRGNGDFTTSLLLRLAQAKKPPVLLSSSTQAALQNPYGQSKRAAEDAAFAYGERTGAPVYVYRLTNAFGKWSRPFYNSAVATFCHSVARGKPITVNDPATVLRLNYIDDIVAAFLDALRGEPLRDGRYCAVEPTHEIALGKLAETLYAFRDARDRFDLVDQTDPLTRKLYATYLSFLPPDDFARAPASHTDARGSFTELMHMGGYGQMSVNVSKPHIVKGEHWHHTKHEKFVVVAGAGVIRFRKLGDDTVVSYKVSGDVPMVVDIPPGYTHNIENLGDTDMVTLMWANERFDPEKPDTLRLPVERNDQP